MAMIDADKLHLKLLDMEFPIQDQDAILDAMDDCIVDTAPVAHGQWIICHDGPYGRRRAYCSACKKHSGIGGIIENQMKPYCPNCGAKMDLNDGRA